MVNATNDAIHPSISSISSWAVLAAPHVVTPNISRHSSVVLRTATVVFVGRLVVGAGVAVVVGAVVIAASLTSRSLQVWQQLFLCSDEQGTGLVSRSVQTAQSP